jgi:general secretion pathway protein J
MRGFTLIEVMSALLILSLVAVMSFRGLGAVLDARDHVRQETEKWQHVAAFFSRFERDLHLSAPHPLRTAPGQLEFSRFATTEGVDAPRRVAYRLNGDHAIEMSVLPGFEAAHGGSAEARPIRYVALPAVTQFDLQYLAPELVWVDAWPRSARDAALPRAVRLRIVLASGEELVRIFAAK